MKKEPEAMTPGRSILVLCKCSAQRLVAANAFRRQGAVVVEAASVRQAGTMLRHFRFDLLAVELFGLGRDVDDFLRDINVIAMPYPAGASLGEGDIHSHRRRSA